MCIVTKACGCSTSRAEAHILGRPALGQIKVGIIRPCRSVMGSCSVPPDRAGPGRREGLASQEVDSASSGSFTSARIANNGEQYRHVTATTAATWPICRQAKSKALCN